VCMQMCMHVLLILPHEDLLALAQVPLAGLLGWCDSLVAIEGFALLCAVTPYSPVLYWLVIPE